MSCSLFQQESDSWGKGVFWEAEGLLKAHPSAPFSPVLPALALYGVGLRRLGDASVIYQQQLLCSFVSSPAPAAATPSSVCPALLSCEVTENC